MILSDLVILTGRESQHATGCEQHKANLEASMNLKLQPASQNSSSHKILKSPASQYLYHVILVITRKTY